MGDYVSFFSNSNNNANMTIEKAMALPVLDANNIIAKTAIKTTAIRNIFFIKDPTILY